MIELRYVCEGKLDTGKIYRGTIAVDRGIPKFVYFREDSNRWIVESLSQENGKPNFKFK